MSECDVMEAFSLVYAVVGLSVCAAWLLEMRRQRALLRDRIGWLKSLRMVERS